MNFFVLHSKEKWTHHQILFPPWIPLVYVYIYGTIHLYIYCVSFFILTDSVIILSVVMSFHTQAYKAHAKCYLSHSYIIQLHYRFINIMDFVGKYIYTYIRTKMTLSWKNLLFIYLKRNDPVMTSLFLYCSSFRLGVTWSRHALHLLFKWKQCWLRKLLLCICYN